MRKRLGAAAVPVQYPLYEQGELVGVIDLLERRVLAAPIDQTDWRLVLIRPGSGIDPASE